MKRLLGLIIALVVLLAIYLVVQNQRNKSAAPERITNFLNLNKNKIDRFLVERLGSRVELKMVNGRWHVMIDSVPKLADSATVNSVLDMAVNIEVGAIESSNPEKRTVYQVDTMLGTKLTFYGGEEQLASVIIGKNAQGYNYSYVRKVDSDDVYRAKDLMAYMFNKPGNNWRDRAILAVDTANLNSIEFHYPDNSFSLERTDTLWYIMGDNIPESKRADRDSVEVFKRLLVDFKTDDFYQDIDSAFSVPDRPELELILKYIDGSADRLMVYGASENENRFYLQKEGLDEVFVLHKSKYSQLTRGSNNFISSEKNG